MEIADEKDSQNGQCTPEAALGTESRELRGMAENEEIYTGSGSSKNKGFAEEGNFVLHGETPLYENVQR